MTDVHFINVGYGDASLIIKNELAGRQFCMLIDSGGETTGDDDTAGSRILAWEYIKLLGIKKIDIVLLTHLHLDHAGGILEIANRFAVGELWTNYVPSAPLRHKTIYTNEMLCSGPRNLLACLRLYVEALKTLAANGTRFREITTGFPMDGLPLQGCILAGEFGLYTRQKDILDQTIAHGAENKLLSEEDSFINNTSLRLTLNTEGCVFVFAGDISAAEWEREEIGTADVVKIPHHGHTDSMNESIAKKLNARYAVVSVSNTRKDCPSPQVLKILENAGASVLFTDSVHIPGRQAGPKHRAIVFHLEEGGLHPEFCV